MRRGFVVLLCVAASVAGTVTAGAATKPPKPVTLTQSQLDAALITVTDLPVEEGFHKNPEAAPVNPPTESEGICNGPNDQGAAENAGQTQSVYTNFYKLPDPSRPGPARGPNPEETIYGFSSVKAAKKFMKTYSAQSDACGGAWMANSSGDACSDCEPKVAWTLTKIVTDPKLGDGTFGMETVVAETLGFAPGDGQGVVDSVFTRVDKYVAENARVGFTDTMQGAADKVNAQASIATARLVKALASARTTKR
jgi:hypothetical protein